MAPAVDPPPSSEELAAIVAALEILAEPAAVAPPKPSRWRLAAREYDAWDGAR